MSSSAKLYVGDGDGDGEATLPEAVPAVACEPPVAPAPEPAPLPVLTGVEARPLLPGLPAPGPPGLELPGPAPLGPFTWAITGAAPPATSALAAIRSKSAMLPFKVVPFPNVDDRGAVLLPDRQHRYAARNVCFYLDINAPRLLGRGAPARRSMAQRID